MGMIILPPSDWSTIDDFFTTLNAWIKHYKTLPPQWHYSFRKSQNFASMVDDYLGNHIQQIFKFRALKESLKRLEISDDDIEELFLIITDIYTELYLKYINMFYTIAKRNGFRPITTGFVDGNSHIILITLSLSSVYFSPSIISEKGRRYLYKNLYDNKEDIPPSGLCMLTDELSMLHRVKTTSFVSSPVLFMFESIENWDIKEILSELFEPIKEKFHNMKLSLENELLFHIGQAAQGSLKENSSLKNNKILIFPYNNTKDLNQS